MAVNIGVDYNFHGNPESGDDGVAVAANSTTNYGGFSPAEDTTSNVLVTFRGALLFSKRISVNCQPPANPGDSKNCSDFPNYAAAKAWFDTYYPYYGDVARLDFDNNLIPCESLPGAPR